MYDDVLVGTNKYNCSLCLCGKCKRCLKYYHIDNVSDCNSCERCNGKVEMCFQKNIDERYRKEFEFFEGYEPRKYF